MPPNHDCLKAFRSAPTLPGNHRVSPPVVDVWTTKRLILFICACLSLFGAVGCRREVVVTERPVAEPSAPLLEPVAKTKTLETSRLGDAINDYEREPTAANNAEVKKRLARLDEEIAELEQYIANHNGDDRAKASAKLGNMQAYRVAESLRFKALQAKAGVDAPATFDDRTGAEKAKETARKVGDDIQETGRKVGDAIKDAVHGH